MVKIKVIRTGHASLNKKLERLTNAQAKQAVREAARPALKPVMAMARSLAPKKTGLLKRAIKVRALKRSRARVGMSCSTNVKHLRTSKAFYGAFQEFGWHTGRRFPGGKARKDGTHRLMGEKFIEGKHFLKRAATRTRRSAIRDYRSGIIAFIRKVTWR